MMFLPFPLITFLLSSTVLSSPVSDHRAQPNQTHSTTAPIPPSSSLSASSASAAAAAVAFAADSTINVAGIYNAMKNANSQGLARYSSGPGTNDVEIYGDLTDITGQPVFTFMADMDVDCDGSFASKCLDDPSGQEETSWGHLDASKVPWYVIPITFSDARPKDLRPNALGAIICGGKMFYAIFGDEMGDFPQLIGEASLLLAQTCFPSEGLSGDNGHEPRDVAYIVFGTQVPSAVGDKTIDLKALKNLGDQQVLELQDALGL